MEDARNISTRMVEPLVGFPPGVQKPQHNNLQKIKSKIEISELNVYYGRFRALTDINLEIPESKSPQSSDPRDVESLLFCVL